MPTPTTRPPNQEERKIIERIQRAGPGWSNDLLGAGCVAMLVLFVGALVSKFTGILRGREYWYFWLGIVIGLAVMFRMRARMSRFRKSATRDIELPVEEMVYEISCAIKIEEFEDEGSNYYLELADSTVLFLSGQYLYELEEDHKFPSSQVKIVRTSGTKTVLDIVCSGNYITPSAVLPAFSKERLRKGDIPSDGEILSIPFETLLPK